MAELICTIKEYNKFVGPRIRNAIQTLTKQRKNELNHICQMCNQKKELEAAHIRGNDRKQIIKKILSKYIIDEKKEIVKIDLENIENEIMAAHKPIDKYFKFLCSRCHAKYDAEKLTQLQPQ